MIKIITFYRFLAINKSRLPLVREELTFSARKHNIRGLIVIASEGINGTIAGLEDDIVKFHELILEKLSLEELVFKSSYADENPFKRFKVDIRDEIVTMGQQVPLPKMDTRMRLSPEQWQELITSAQENFVLLDVRNHYESLLGTFENSIVPELNSFGEFPEYVKSCGIEKDKKVLMFCTGGIRCEKAAVEMKKQGYKDVFQLQGGILNYLEKFPDQKFKGECFVFDERVSVDQNLKPSANYHLCPHCGDPGCLPISCKQCSKRAVICDRCARTEEYQTCSKNCRYHFERETKARRYLV